jgi:class 3 adenylate cyclase
MNDVRDIGILFGDVAGSTKLYDVFGDHAAFAAVDLCVRLMGEAVTENGGTVLKTIGDEVMAVLPTAAATFAAAVSMQHRIANLAPLAGPAGETRLSLRVGFHFGPAIVLNADYFGDTVNLAARMVALARAGEILTTGDTMDRLGPLQRAFAREFEHMPVKGKADDVRVVVVLWRAGDDFDDLTSQVSQRPTSFPGARPRPLRLSSEEGEWSFDGSRASIALGRERTSDVVVSDSKASRRHATIERRRDKWFLVDHSTNGTFVTFEGEAEIGLLREEVILRGSGVICFGHALADGGPGNVMHFSLR